MIYLLAGAGAPWPQTSFEFLLAPASFAVH